MEAVANNPAFAKKAGVPQSVGKDFAAADKKLQLKGGPRSRPDLQKVNESKTLHGKSQLFKEGGNMATKKMSSKMMAFEKSGKDVEKKGMKEGSKADMAMDKKQMAGMKKGGMAGGGTFRASANGVASKGKTKGTQIKMNKGVMPC